MNYDIPAPEGDMPYTYIDQGAFEGGSLSALPAAGNAAFGYKEQLNSGLDGDGRLGELSWRMLDQLRGRTDPLDVNPPTMRTGQRRTPMQNTLPLDSLSDSGPQDERFVVDPRRALLPLDVVEFTAPDPKTGILTTWVEEREETRLRISIDPTD